MLAMVLLEVDLKGEVPVSYRSSGSRFGFSQGPPLSLVFRSAGRCILQVDSVKAEWNGAFLLLLDSAWKWKRAGWPLIGNEKHHAVVESCGVRRL